MGGNDPNALKFFGVRFTSPVKPGDELETLIWEVGPMKGLEKEKVVEVAFVTRVSGSGKVGHCLLVSRDIAGDSNDVIRC